MIDFIKGILISKKPAQCVIESGGIGYEINITLSAFEKLPQNGAETSLYTVLHVRDNPVNLILYGFSDSSERECFRQIISVSGIGPKTAMSILSSIGAGALIQQITSGNFLPLTSVPGVGRKTAERLAVELKDKFCKAGKDDARYLSVTSTESQKLSEIILVLISLGYNRAEAEKKVDNFIRQKSVREMRVEDAVRDILKSN